MALQVPLDRPWGDAPGKIPSSLHLHHAIQGYLRLRVQGHINNKLYLASVHEELEKSNWHSGFAHKNFIKIDDIEYANDLR
jgi:hypothetical protein